MSWNLETLANIVKGDLFGPKDKIILAPVSAGTHNPEGITFAENNKYLGIVEETQVGAILVPRELQPSRIPYIQVDSPKLAFLKILKLAEKNLTLNEGIHPTAVVHPSAEVHPTASIGPFTIINPEVKVRENVQIHGHCFIGDHSQIGEGSILYPNVTLYHQVSLGRKCIIHGGTVIGKDGFGFEWNGQEHFKIPQVGIVEIGDNVEIGAQSSVARAAMGSTKIGSGTKIDDLVLVAHNVEIGDHSILCGTSAVAGSTKIGNFVVMGGGSKVSDHITITSQARFGAGSMIGYDINEPGDYAGNLAIPIQSEMRRRAIFNKLPELQKRVRELERMIKILQEDLKEEKELV
jgi:UDP-3-O-[3-hydroxymyristoyl] glucosamine N-acyltransferase